MSASSFPQGKVIVSEGLLSNNFLSGLPGVTHTVDENLKITNDLSVGTGSQHTGIITMNNKIYSSVAPSGTETSGGIATYDAALHFSIYDGKELRFYNYDGSNGTATAYAGIKSSTETRYPSFNRLGTSIEPTYPAPPVIKIEVIISFFKVLF